MAEDPKKKDNSNKKIDKDTTWTQQRGPKQRTEATLVKRDNLFIQKEGENYETPPDEVVALSILFILYGNIWDTQAMKMWLKHLNYVPYYRRTIYAATILYYWIYVDLLGMLEDN